jgi:hypothetical protein
MLIALQFFWVAANAFYTLLQSAVWVLTGTYWSLLWSRRPENYDHSAQVLRVVARYKFDEYQFPTTTWDFVLIHERFDSPERVLQDHASLYQVTDKEAIFVEAPPGHELWRSRYSPFLCYAQFRYAVRVVRMPIASFHRLADRVGDPTNLTFIMHTTRCGSTLLTHMFEETGKIVTISQPSVLNALPLKAEAKSGRDQDSLNHVTVSVVRLLCKPTLSGVEPGTAAAYVLKTSIAATGRLPNILSQFPHARCLFVYRDGLKVAQSLYRLSCSLPAHKFIYTFGRNSARRLAFCVSEMGFPGEDARVSLKHPLSLGAMLWAVVQRYYIRFRDAGLPVAAVRYEDVVADPDANMRRILRHCGLPEDWWAPTGGSRRRSVLDVDSQLGSPFASSSLARFPTLDYGGEARDETDRVLDAMGLPPFGSERPYVAPGTITICGGGV